MVLTGEADAFGHRRLGGIGAVTAEAIKKITGIGIIFQPLFYLMRSGSPESLDLMVAMNYANMAIELIRKKSTGRMVALKDGRYTAVDITAVTGGASVWVDLLDLAGQMVVDFDGIDRTVDEPADQRGAGAVVAHCAPLLMRVAVHHQHHRSSALERHIDGLVVHHVVVTRVDATPVGAGLQGAQAALAAGVLRYGGDRPVPIV